MPRAVIACRVAATVFGVVGCLHAWRLVSRTQVLVGTWQVPLMASWVGLLVAGGLAWWLWRSAES